MRLGQMLLGAMGRGWRFADTDPQFGSGDALLLQTGSDALLLQTGSDKLLLEG